MAPQPPAAPLPRAPSVGSAVLICCLCNLSEAVAGNLLWPILPFLVARFDTRPADVGFYVGMLGSAYFLGQTLTVRTWGALSDRYGRRPILLFGLLGSLITSAWFGFASSYTEALAARFMCGILNGNVSIAKVYVGEVSNAQTQATGFSMLSLTWGLGILCAPVLGGFLADPAALYPGSALDTPLLRHHPFLLPSLVSAGFSALCLALALPLLKETAQWQRRKAAAAAASAAAGGGSASGGGAHAAVATSEPEDEGAGTALEVEGGSDGSGGSELSDSDLEGSEEGEAAPLTSSGSSSSAAVAAAPSIAAAAVGGRGAAAAPLPPEAEGTPSKSKGDAAAAPGAPAPPPPPPPSAITAASSSLAICLDPALSPAIAAYATLAALQILFDELMPVFSSTDPALGGLGWRSSDIGSIGLAAGATQILSTLCIVPVLQRRLGIRASFLAFMYPLVPYFLLFPLVARLAPWPHALYAAMCVLMSTRTLLFSLPFSSIMIALNNVAPPEHLGLVVSVAQAVASGIRTLGPTLGGGLFSASVALDALGSWRLSGPYVLMSALAALTLALGARISRQCEAPPPAAV